MNKSNQKRRILVFLVFIQSMFIPIGIFVVVVFARWAAARLRGAISSFMTIDGLMIVAVVFSAFAAAAIVGLGICIKKLVDLKKTAE